MNLTTETQSPGFWDFKDYDPPPLNPKNREIQGIVLEPHYRKAVHPDSGISGFTPAVLNPMNPEIYVPVFGTRRHCHVAAVRRKNSTPGFWDFKDYEQLLNPKNPEI